MIFVLCIFCYLALTSLIAYRAFAQDKRFAEANRGIPRDREHAAQRVQRTPESKLLFYALIGGWPGAKYAQQKLRHKSYKQPFGKQLNDIGMILGAAFSTFALIFSVLFLLDAPDPSVRVAANAAVPMLQPAGVPPQISLRPPAVRPVAW